MLFSMKLALIPSLGLCVLLCPAITSQVPAAKVEPPAAVVPPSGTASSSTSVFHSDSLQMTFRYPKDLEQQTAATFREVMERGHREHYKTDPKSDPEHQEADKCMHVLLYARTSDSSKPEITIHGKDNGSTISLQQTPMGVIMIAEFDPSCIPHGTKENDILGQLASISGQLPGLKPIDQQMWYEVDKHKVHFLAAQGTFSDDKTGTPVGIATASVNVHGHFMLWMFMSDDLTTLDRIMASTIQFDDHPATPFVPFTLGTGEPIKLVP